MLGLVNADNDTYKRLFTSLLRVDFAADVLRLGFAAGCEARLCLAVGM